MNPMGRNKATAIGSLFCALFASTQPGLKGLRIPPIVSPIKHVVVIFQENISFDHYFATYPHAANPPGEPQFRARSGTPSVNGLSADMLTRNPNSVQPFRLDRSRQLLCNPTPYYPAEHAAYHAGLLDRFPESTGQTANTNPPCEFGLGTGMVMGYYDGN